MSNSVKTYTKKEAAGFLTGMFGQNLIYNVIVRQYYCTFSCCGYAFVLCCMPVQAQTKASWLCVSYQ